MSSCAWASRHGFASWRATTSTSRRQSLGRCSRQQHQLSSLDMAIVLVACDLLLLAASLLLLVPSMVLLAEVCAARHARGAVGAPSVPRPALAVLIPAHDEAGGIAATIRAVIAQLRPCDRLLVVADNCSDDTASVAMSLGAEVIERRDPSLRGKGYALDHGVRHLER